MNVAARHQAALSELSRMALAGAELSTLRNQAVTLVAATLAVEYSGIWDLRADAAVMVSIIFYGYRNRLSFWYRFTFRYRSSSHRQLVWC